LTVENNDLKKFKSEISSRVELAELLLKREEEMVVATKGFLLKKGYISQGVANMLIAGTIPSILDEFSNTGGVSSTMITSLAGAPAASNPSSGTEQAELQKRLDASKALVLRMQDELAEANKARIKATQAAQEVKMTRAKITALEREIENLRSQLVKAPPAVSVPVFVAPSPVVAVDDSRVKAADEKTTKLKETHSKELAALKASVQTQLEAKDAEIKKLAAAVKSAESVSAKAGKDGSAADKAKWEAKLSVLEADKEALKMELSSLAKEKKSELAAMRMEKDAEVITIRKESEAELKTLRKQKQEPAVSGGDMEAYLSQLKAENEELKSRLLASDEQLMDLTTDMQKKVDSAKEMAKMLNAQLLQRSSEFEKRESTSMRSLHLLRSYEVSLSCYV
jgi:DNA repair exonuclease SbcCD ATPase subunit